MVQKMEKTIVVLLLILLAGWVEGVTFTKTWDQHIELLQITFASISSFTPTSTITSTFATPKTNTNYAYAIAITDLGHDYTAVSGEGRYSLYVDRTGANSTTSIQFTAGSWINVSVISLLKCRCLIVEGSFPYLSIVHFERPFSNVSTAYTPTGYDNEFLVPTAFPLSLPDDYIFYMIRGYDILDKAGSNDKYSIQSHCFIKAGTISLYCQIKAADLNDYLYHYFAVEVIVYHRQLMLNTFGGGILEDNREVSDSTIEDFNVTNYNSNLVFMGTKEITNRKRNSLHGISFTIDVTSHPIAVTLFNQQYIIWVFFLYFETTVVCGSGQIWNNTAMLCEPCGLDQYVLGSGASAQCASCTFYGDNCTQCNSLTCTECANMSALNGSSCFLCADAFANCELCDSTSCSTCIDSSHYNNGTNCYLCGDVWPNCDSCDGNQCLACSHPYLLNISQCLLCGDIWANCSNCTLYGCNACQTPYQLNGTQCFLCQDTWSNCQICNTSACINCTNPYVSNLTSCFLCGSRWPNCDSCDAGGCLNCSLGYIWNSTDCFNCQDIEGCSQCSNMTVCTSCAYPYTQNGSLCSPDCSLVSNCTSCSVNNGRILCSACSYGFSIVENQCLSICGDGAMIDAEECDDGNSQDRDGCSSSCQVQQYFNCTSTSVLPLSTPSVCELTQLDFSITSLGKVADKNEVILTLDLYPQNLLLYDTADWAQAFSFLSHNLTVISTDLEQGKRLRVSIAYNQNLHGQIIQANTNFSAISSSVNVGLVSLTLPEKTSNNQALYYYQQSSYSLATAVRYLSLFVSAASLILFLIGYFGSKLQSLQAAAVVQVSALLLMTVQNMGPTFQGLRNLRYSLGITPIFEGQYYFEDGNIPSHIKPILSSRNSISLINIGLIVIFVPILTGIILKILSKSCYKQSRMIDRAWRYSFGTFLFYGLLFLAYAELSCLILNFRYLTVDTQFGIGVAVEFIFLAALVIWTIATTKYFLWFGSFKNKFFQFEISQYFYIFSSTQRFLTAIIIISSSPGPITIALLALIFTVQSLFIAIKKVYILRHWKRPLFNKIAAVVICLLFVGAIATEANSMIHQFIPIGIILLLIAVLVVGFIGSVLQLKEYWSTWTEKVKAEEKAGPPLTVDQSHNLLMQQFQKKIMPDLKNSSAILSPLDLLDQEQPTNDKWNWQNYAVLSTSIDSPTKIRQNFRRVKKQIYGNEKKKDCQTIQEQSDSI